jgi:hypothetical protein
MTHALDGRFLYIMPKINQLLSRELTTAPTLKVTIVLQ